MSAIHERAAVSVLVAAGMLAAAACESFTGSEDAPATPDAASDAAARPDDPADAGEDALSLRDAAEPTQGCAKYDGGAFCDDFDRGTSIGLPWTTECTAGKLGVIPQGLSVPNALSTERTLVGDGGGLVGGCRAVVASGVGVTQSLVVRASLRVPKLAADYVILVVVEGLPVTLQLVRFADQRTELKVLKASDGALLQTASLAKLDLAPWTDVTVRMKVGTSPAIAVRIGTSSEQVLTLVPQAAALLVPNEASALVGVGVNQIAGTSGANATVLVDDVAVFVEAP